MALSALACVVQLAGRRPQNESSQVQSLIGAHAWVAGLVMYERQLIDVSFSHRCFSPSLSPSPLSPLSKINK